MISTKKIILFLSIISMVGCTFNNKHNQKISKSDNTHRVKLDYATGFRIDTCGNKSYLTIFSPDDSSKVVERFTLVKKHKGQHLKKNEIAVPCKRIICLSSTQLAYLIKLNSLDDIVGINSSKYLSNKKINERIKNNTVQKVGIDGVFNTEKIISLAPDIIFVSPFKRGGYDAIKNLNIPLISMSAYGEDTPLGRAEWIKMIGLFTGKTTEADSIFNYIKNDYNRLKALTKNVKHKPTVFSGKLKAGVWYVPGGDSYFAHYFRDAGADYIIKNNNKDAIPMDYESIYSRAHNTEYWRLLTSSPKGFNKHALKIEDARYATFKAFDTGNILVCNLRQTPYREESCIKPNVLLADYIYQFHPDLLPNYKPVFWKRIKP